MQPNKGKDPDLNYDPSPSIAAGKITTCMVLRYPEMQQHMLAIFARAGENRGREESRKHGPIRTGLRQAMRKRDGCLFGEVAGVVGLFHAIGICEFLHTLGVIIIGAITATPCRLRRWHWISW